VPPIAHGCELCVITAAIASYVMLTKSSYQLKATAANRHELQQLVANK